MFLQCFSVNDSATTEIYPSRRTPSLHDALPIYWLRMSLKSSPSLFTSTSSAHSVLLPRYSNVAQWAVGRTKALELMEMPCVRRCLRSEEHTSELQSLMRISYAVFCLKKTKSTHDNYRRRITRAQLQTVD